MGDDDKNIRKLLTQAIASFRKGSPEKKRAEIASKMTTLLGCRVTRFMLNDYSRAITDPGRISRFPAAFVRVFCEVTGDREFARFLLPAEWRDALFIGERVIEASGSLR